MPQILKQIKTPCTPAELENAIITFCSHSGKWDSSTIVAENGVISLISSDTLDPKLKKSQPPNTTHNPS